MIRRLRGYSRTLLWILGTSLVPPAVFFSVAYYYDVTSARTSLKTAVDQGVRRIDILLSTADKTLTDVANYVDSDDPNAASLLQKIVYDEPLFREIGVVNQDGFLVLTNLGAIDPPVWLNPETRPDLNNKTLQILGPVKTRIMQEESIVLSLPTRGEGEVNALVDPTILTADWGSNIQLDLGPDGFLVYLNNTSGQILAGQGDIPTVETVDLDPHADRIQFVETSQNGEVLVIGEVSKAWILWEWRNQLLLGGPITALCSGLLIVLSIRLLRQSMGLDRELSIGFRNQELVVHYQPVVNLHTGDYIGSEALLRWYHPQQGVLSPALFIPTAEKTGLINDIGAWLIKKVVEEQATLYHQFPDLYTSINLSPNQLHSGSLDQLILWLKKNNVCSPNRFVVEVTENVIIRDYGTTSSDTLARLRHLGVRVALDDFGTGYSGLNYLHQFDVDQLKIDRFYIAAINKDLLLTNILETIIDLGHRLGVTLVAEGIETEEQRQFLCDRGVVYGQGWLFARPLPIQEFEQYFTEHQSSSGP